MIFYKHFVDNKEIYARFGGLLKLKAFNISKPMLNIIQHLYNNRDNSMLFGLFHSFLDYKKQEKRFLDEIKKEYGLTQKDLKKIRSDFLRFFASNSKYTGLPFIRHALMLSGHYKETYKSFEFISSVASSLLNMPSGVVLSNIIGNVFDADTKYAAKAISENFNNLSSAKYDYYTQHGFDFKAVVSNL